MTVRDEALRQQALLAALIGGTLPALREAPARAERGLAAYRANAQAHAVRALSAVYPTVQAMLGEADFAQLARDHWRAEPPTSGDLGEWGGTLPQRIEAIADLAEWPWLADSARLDLAMHRCERAADAQPRRASFDLLREGDPAHLRLLPAPGLTLVVSRHPIATIRAAHHSSAADAFAAVRRALAAGRGESVCVARQGWRAVLHLVDAGETAFVEALLGGESLAEAILRGGTRFDFGATFARALQAQWLTGAAATRYSDPSNPR